MDSTQDRKNMTITAEQLAEARTRARLTQRELAALLQHSTRAVQVWEERGVHPAKVGLVRSVLGAHLEGVADNTLAQFSNMALLAELAKRLDAAGTNRDDSETERVRGFSPA